VKRDADLRQKYFDAIAQLEAGEARWSQLEVTLRRLIGRLCLAARGRAASLDVELRKVSDLARGRGDMSAIEESLEPLKFGSDDYFPRPRIFRLCSSFRGHVDIAAGIARGASKRGPGG
jgi:hypothetical protein